MITLAIALAFTMPQERPYQQNAQCLAEIARLSGDRLDMLQPWMLEAAQRKADALWEAEVKVWDAQADVDTAATAALAKAARDEAEGRLPSGSRDLMSEQLENDRAELARGSAQLRMSTPNCRWPATPARPDQSVP